MALLFVLMPGLILLIVLDTYAKRIIITTATVMECDDQNKTGCRVLATESAMRELKAKNTTDHSLKSY